MHTISYAKYEVARGVLDRGGNLREAARIAGIAEQTVSKIAEGYVPPKPDAVRVKNCRAYRCGECGRKVTTKPCMGCLVEAKP